MSVTILLIIITAAASFYAWKTPEIYSKWILNPYSIKTKKEYFRFLTSGFIHADVGHLVFNMFSLYFIGQYLEGIFEIWFGTNGMLFYLALYLIGIIVSEIPSFIKHRNDYNYNSLGASGGVSSIIFSFILIAPTQTLVLYFIPIPAVIFGALYLIYSFMQARKATDNINHDAHFYGAVFGILFTIGVMPSVLLSFVDQLINWNIIESIFN